MANRLNTKEITRCTLPFYDSDFVKKLNDLYGKIGGAQQAFLGMLVNVVCDNVCLVAVMMRER